MRNEQRLIVEIFLAVVLAVLAAKVIQGEDLDERMGVYRRNKCESVDIKKK